MSFLKQLFDLYIKSSLHVGLAVLCLVYVTAFSNNLTTDFGYPLCVFFGTVVCYNLLKYIELLFKNRIQFKSLWSIYFVTFFALIGFLFLFLELKSNFQIQLVYVGILVLIYPFLRKLAWLKISLVAICVSLVSVHIPYLTVKFLPIEYYITFLQRFIFVIIWIIPFEISDSNYDLISLNTIVQKHGIRKTKLFGILLVIPFLILEYSQVNYNLSCIPIAISLVLFLHFSSEKRNDYYASFWVESIPIWWLLLFYIFG